MLGAGLLIDARELARLQSWYGNGLSVYVRLLICMQWIKFWDRSEGLPVSWM